MFALSVWCYIARQEQIPVMARGSFRYGWRGEMRMQGQRPAICGSGRQMHCVKVDVACQLLLTKGGVRSSRGSRRIDDTQRSFSWCRRAPFLRIPLPSWGRRSGEDIEAWKSHWPDYDKGEEPYFTKGRWCCVLYTNGEQDLNGQMWISKQALEGECETTVNEWHLCKFGCWSRTRSLWSGSFPVHEWRYSAPSSHTAKGEMYECSEVVVRVVDCGFLRNCSFPPFDTQQKTK